MDTVQKVRDFYMCFGNGFDNVYCRGCHVKKTCDKETRLPRSASSTILRETSVHRKEALQGKH